MKAGTHTAPFVPQWACLTSVLLVGLCASLHAEEVPQESPDERIVAGLRERGLFELAATHCKQELASKSLPANRRAVLTIELARVYAEQAVKAPAEEREALWKQALAVTAEFQAAHVDSPRVILVQLQGALVELARGELERQDTRTLADGSEQLKVAKDHLRRAIGQLEAVRRVVDERLRRTPRQATTKGNELTAVELEALAKNVAFQLARAARNQAECYSANSPDRANSVTQALELLDPLAELAVVDDLVWRSRIEQVVCYRLLKDPARAAAVLERILKNNPPPQVALRARAEAQLAGPGSQPTAPDESGPGRAAAELYQAGKLEQAVEAYERAARQARSQGQGAPAFTWELAAAAIEQERGKHAAGRDRYRALALAQKTEPRAGEAHLLAAFAAAALARTAKESEQAALLEAYGQLLAEHLANWPQGATADRARLMLGELRTAQHRWKDVVESLLNVDPAGPEYETALRTTFAAYERWIAELPPGSPPASVLAVEAAETFERVANGAEQAENNQPTDEQRAAVIFAARLRIKHAQRGYGDVARLLAAVLAKSDDAPESWKSEARSLLVLSLAGADKLPEAGRELESLSTAPIDEVVELIQDLARMVDSAKPGSRRDLAELELRAIALVEVQPEELPTETQPVIERLKAAALVAAERNREALTAFDALVKKNQLDGDLRETRAQLLATSGDRAALARALAEWRAIEEQCKPGSARWFRARLGQAVVLRRQALPDEAQRLIRLTAALQPELGGPAMKARFEQLRLDCERAK